MSRASGVRTSPCTRVDARTRLQQAEAHLLVAQLCLDDKDELATPSVAASLAILAGIAACDAACCARLGRRARGQDHTQAVDLVRTVAPHGAELAKCLNEVLSAKDQAHYGLLLVTPAKARALVRRAERLISLAAEVLAA